MKRSLKKVADFEGGYRKINRGDRDVCAPGPKLHGMIGGDNSLDLFPR